MFRRVSAWCLALSAALLWLACDDSHRASLDGGSDATVSDSPTMAAAQKACDTMSQCDGFDMLVSKKECTTELSEHLESMDSKRCLECIGEITCAGWEAVGRGEKTACEICDVCGCADDSGTRSGSDSGPTNAPECVAGTKSTPNAPDDPCPQNDPKCPAAMFDAVTTCGPDSRWMRTPDSSIQCVCVPRSAGQ